jgi:hypothetical protein
MTSIVGGTSGFTFPDGTTQTTAAGASALTLISTQTASNSAALSWTNLSGYTNYILIFKNLILSSSTYPLLQIGTGTTPTWVSSGYYQAGTTYSNSDSVRAINNPAGSNFSLSNEWSGTNTSAPYGITGVCNFSGLQNYFLITGQAGGWVSSSVFENDTYSGGVNSSNVTTAIKIYVASGNITSGTASLYGITS